MRRVGRFVGRLLLLAVIVFAVVWTFGPTEPVNLTPRFDAAGLPEDLDSYLATTEGMMGAVTPGAEKRIIWAAQKGATTDIALVYLHGFSATSEEIRPVPDNVAKALGANLFYTRFAGHGLPGDRLSGPSVQDWMDDVAEALAIGHRLGKKVVVIATSTGGTLAAEAAVNPVLKDKMAGVVLISPNFALNSLAATILTWPAVRYWGPVVAGRERCFDAVNAVHKKFWTTCYPTTALFPMAALAAHARGEDYSQVSIPALFIYSREDKVVSPAETERIAAAWGGGHQTMLALKVGASDDAYSHVIAGNALSPSMTTAVTNDIIRWVRENIARK